MAPRPPPSAVAVALLRAVWPASTVMPPEVKMSAAEPMEASL
jgi:hypothetical protein